MRVNLPVTNQEYVLEDGQILVSRTTAKGVITYASDSFVAASGFTREELLGQAHNLVRHPDMPPAAFADMWQTIKSGRPWSAIVKNRRKEGGFYWVRANVSAIASDGNIVGFISIRTKATRGEIEEATALYAKMRAGTLRGATLRGGELVYTGARGLLQRLRGISFRARCWGTASGFSALFLALGTFLLAAPGEATTPLALCALGAIASLAVGARAMRSVGHPVIDAVDTAHRIMMGDVGASFPKRGDPGLLQLFRAMEQVNRNLLGVLQDVRSSTGTVEGAATSIARGSMDLARRTQEQAASLEETAASMEELTSTVKQNADNARQASQHAAGASTLAATGGEVVTRVVTSMSSINDSSRKIADILGVIDGIAFQTNILALNAAVEAARAGEQGRGFAVVAGEVRTLAQRSAAAAKEIKALITDSVAKVDDGTKLVDQAGKTMGEIVTSVQRVTDIMAEIASASKEQTSGIEQISQAIVQIDQVTQQNATLVDEATAATESMLQQAQILNQAISVFQLGAVGPDAQSSVQLNRHATAAEPSKVERAGRHAQHGQTERRSPNRANNISRLPRAKASASKPAKMANGDDHWQEF